MKKKSVFICDFDGKILSFNKNCENFFGYSKYEIINIKRIYNLIHADFIIQFIKKFNQFKQNKDNTIKFNLNIINKCNNVSSVLFIFTKFNEKEFILVEFLNIDFINYKPKKNLIELANIIFRGKFTLGSLIPFFFSFFWSVNNFDEHSNISAILLFVGLLFFHISANTFNDYFDWKSGRDRLNIDYILFSTGGSRALDFRLISEKKLLFFSILSFLIVVVCGLFLCYIRGINILIFGLAGSFCVYFYSAPPIHLASRYGLGELMHVICLGPLIVYGSVFSLTGFSFFKDFFIGMPFGLLITGCLLLNEAPDSKFDRLSGKKNLAVILGFKYIPYLFYFLLFLAFFCVIFGMCLFNFSKNYFLIFLLIPYLLVSIKFLFNLDKGRSFVLESCDRSFYIYLYFSLILLIITVFELIFYFYPW